MATKDKYSIDYQGLTIGNHSFALNFGADLFELYPYGGVDQGEGDITIELIKHSNHLELFVHIEGIVGLGCDRCSDFYEQPIVFNGEVVVKLNNARSDDNSDDKREYDGDIIWLAVGESRLDLSEWIYESIILSLPLQRVHPLRDDCNAEALKYLVSSESELETVDIDNKETK